MNILERIIRDKRQEVRLKKEVLPGVCFEQFPLFERSCFSLSDSLKSNTSGVIAEHKRRSPSKGTINQNTNVAQIAKGYRDAGASGMSVLTDIKYFGGSSEDLVLARAAVELPLLRKEFIIDPYQIVEAKAYGADAILLIAAVLTRIQIKQLSEFAQSLGLEVLLEVHNPEELVRSLMPSIDLFGVNNRDLRTFTVDLDTSKNLASQIPDDFVKISESGIRSPEVIQELKTYGFQGFLIGECFMKTKNPVAAINDFMHQLRSSDTML